MKGNLELPAGTYLGPIGCHKKFLSNGGLNKAEEDWKMLLLLWYVHVCRQARQWPIGY